MGECANLKTDIDQIKSDIDEQWVEIPGYEGLYYISTKGQVFRGARSFSHGKGHSATTVKPSKILSTCFKSHRYNSVGLTIHGNTTRYYVHRLVATAFLPNPESKECVGHKDDNPRNNEVTNLFWCSQEENLKDMVAKGRSRKGEDVHNSRLTVETVKQIKKLLSEPGAHIPTIARAYGVTRATIHRVKNEVCWKEACRG
jgi:hypothetical protein